MKKAIPNNIVRFNGAAELKAGLAGRGAALRRESRRIATEAAAVEYFGQSAVRKRKVFISYASEDREAAAPFIAAFQGKFESVFNYKDTGMSIPTWDGLDAVD